MGLLHWWRSEQAILKFRLTKTVMFLFGECIFVSFLYSEILFFQFVFWADEPCLLS